MNESTPRTHNPDKLRAPTVDRQGKRRWIYPERRSGPLAKKRRFLAAILILVYLIVPYVKVFELPLLRLDVETSIVYVFGQTFRFADGFYIVFVLLTAALLLVWATSLWGRIWCGNACPQTVFVEWLIRPIEEFFEGPALKRRKNDQGPLTIELLLKKIAKHLSFTLVILIISNAFLAYFVDPKMLWSWVQSSPWDHPQAFLLMSLVFGLLYFDLVWFREQFCSFLCPYARFQSVMISSATPTVAFDYNRGEPRGKRNTTGDCIDCGLCVRVCPVGIDIRQGLQLECIQCMRCSDACNSVMTGIKRPEGLIRLVSERELKGETKIDTRKRKIRVRPLIYFGLLLLNLGIVGYLVGGRETLKITVLRQPSSTFVQLAPDRVANYFSLRVVNQGHSDEKLHLEHSENSNIEIICSICQQNVKRNQELKGNLVIFFDPEKTGQTIGLRVKGSTQMIELPILSPGIQK